MTASNRFLSNSATLIQLCYHLSVRDIVILSRTCRSLHQRLFTDGKVWAERSLVFRPQDRPWLIKPKVMHQLIPSLPRHHDLQRLVIHDIPALDIMTLFVIFDHCAHSIHHLDLSLSLSQCHQLCMHLEAFCFHLATSQAWNKIPLTFHQYTLDSHQLYQQAQQSLAPQQPFFIQQLIAHGLPTRMDDPPFERLDQISLTITPSRDFYQHSTLMQKFHHLVELLSRSSPTFTRSAAVLDTGTSIDPPISDPDIPDLSSSVSSSSSLAESIKRPLENDEKTIKKKNKKSEKDRQYYHRLELLSHHYLLPSISSPPPALFPSRPHRRRTNAPPVHIMRCQPTKK